LVFDQQHSERGCHRRISATLNKISSRRQSTIATPSPRHSKASVCVR
jgi:hypothetical protein